MDFFAGDDSNRILLEALSGNFNDGGSVESNISRAQSQHIRKALIKKDILPMIVLRPAAVLFVAAASMLAYGRDGPVILPVSEVRGQLAEIPVTGA